MTLKSMTGFASAQGQIGDLRWVWEVRSVNGKGLDLRLRVPDWVEGLDAALRARLSKAVARGNVSANLRLTGSAEDGRNMLDHEQMVLALQALQAIESQAMADGVTLGPSTAADIAALRGVMRPTGEEHDIPALRAALLDAADPVIAAFVENRSREGAALAEVLTGQLEHITGLVAAAANLLEHRGAEQKARFSDALARVMDEVDTADPQRVAQELAVLAVKADVTEEIDRLRAHVDAARALIVAKDPVGRKFDFLMQEFNREANTLCSKAGFADLTAIGLDLKVAIDQMREQVQNVE